MKKITISVVAILIGLTTLGTNVPITEKTNEIKFNIKKIESPKVEDEAYINDIPFDTKANFDLYFMTRNIKLEDEKYINDIPFNTKKIARKYLRQNKNIK